MLQRPGKEVGMLSKTPLAITALTAVLFTSCGTFGSAPPSEVNLAFTIENNLLFLTTAEVNNQPGRIFFGSANARTTLDPAFERRLHARRYTLDLNQRDSLPFNPVVMSLGGIGDALIGADVWGGHTITIDYRSGLLTYEKQGLQPEDMALFRFETEPAILVEVDGRSVPVIVDTALPDTLVLPRGAGRSGRRPAHIAIAGTDFGNVDVGLGEVSQARVGNRLLSKFLITLDYGRREIGLWRDPRIPL